MSIDYIWAWLAVMVPLVVSPGPANMLFMAAGAKQGVRGSLPLLAGVDSIFVLISILVGFGLGEFLKAYPTAVAIVKLLGVIYLAYLTWKFFKPVNSNNNQHNSTYGFYDGVIVQLLNPKGWSMVFLMFSLFIGVSENQNQSVMILVVMLALLNIATHLIWISAGAAITRYLSGSSIERYLNTIFGLSLLAVVVWLLIDIFRF